MDTISNIVGLAAAVLTTIAMAPQVVKIARTKNTAGLSLQTFAILSAGIALWFVYGLMISSLPLIAGNSIGLLLTLCIVFMKIKYG
ncbi:MAG: SemiSWEET transporter [Smithellaceae bacterium]|nr:SemiSWEET transporter [Smithellaceae bacterium]